ncbi:hypothetical protein P872_03845 [Rhodonellum psychrophilum GCM71 = DSM 17998]|uniref:LytR family transcriptional regulator n=2 Tax=Rhodonellum TaxID=336827 RepID=U5C1K5_9BACT|nr:MULTISPECIES: LytTR family transcriptional regulator DNA-binding domain-containing protein [Rhodonellum]ERM82801.1 hypothetical protein P872_03845 [Rhodonellum psychrophilum GCM71 = DSM 17998]
MIPILIIDDEPLAAQIVKEYLSDYPDFEVLKICVDGFEGIKAIQEYQPELIFLDVQMPKINGFEMLELLDEPPSVIFTTAFDEYALKAFDAHAVDYLLKPFPKERFSKAIAKFLQLESKSSLKELMESNALPSEGYSSRVVLKVKNEIKIIPVQDIKYFEGNDDYVNVHTQEGKFLKNKTMRFFESTLNPDVFVRVHRSYIVKIAEITKIESYEKDGYLLILRDGKQIPVSKTGFPKLKAVLGI